MATKDKKKTHTHNGKSLHHVTLQEGGATLMLGILDKKKMAALVCDERVIDAFEKGTISWKRMHFNL